MQERNNGVCFGGHRLYLGGEVATSNPILCTPLQLKLERLFLLGLWCLLIGYLDNNCVMLLYYTINFAYSVKFKQAVHTERVPPTQNVLESVA